MQPKVPLTYRTEFALSGQRYRQTLGLAFLASTGNEEEKRAQLLAKMFKSTDPGNPPFIEPPFTCDYVGVLPSY